nr:nuclear transport factor 2 family protein [Rhodoferax sp.]
MQNGVALLLSLCVTSCAVVAPTTGAGSATTSAKDQVIATERAFAKTMADRDHTAFASFVAADTVFFSGPKPLHGKQAVVDFWAKFYKGPDAPFSWEPKEVEVLVSGDLAISSGPVYDPSGKLFATFTSIWRREAPNTWRIVFDKGNPVCDCAAAP